MTQTAGSRCCPSVYLRRSCLFCEVQLLEGRVKVQLCVVTINNCSTAGVVLFTHRLFFAFVNTS